MPHDAASRVVGSPEHGGAGIVVVVPCGTVTVVVVDVAMVVDEILVTTVEGVVGAAVDVVLVDDIVLVVVDDGSCVVVVDVDVVVPTTSVVVVGDRRGGRDGERRAGGARGGRRGRLTGAERGHRGVVGDDHGRRRDVARMHDGQMRGIEIVERVGAVAVIVPSISMGPLACSRLKPFGPVATRLPGGAERQRAGLEVHLAAASVGVHLAPDGERVGRQLDEPAARAASRCCRR